MTLQNNSFCLIWHGYPARSVQPDSSGRMTTVYGSARAGGDYKLTPQIVDRLTNPFRPVDDRARARLTRMLFERRAQGEAVPEITEDTIERAQTANDLPVHARAERLLWYLEWLTKSIGQPIDTSPHSASFPGILGFTESTSESETAFLEDYLRTRGWLVGMPGCPAVSVHGYSHIAYLAAGQQSNKVFVAMWFSDEMEQVYLEAIEPAIIVAGYVPQRVGQGQTTNRIDYEAEAKIRAARLVIADFTHDDGKGVRGSVYYEAGFARALNKPIIFTAKEGSDIHFNVDHFLRIEWKDADDLRTQLTQRIRDLPELQR